MEQFRRIRWLATMWGVITDIFLSEMMGLFVRLAANIPWDAEGEAAESLLRASPLYWPSYLLGIFFSGVGGYVAGRLAGRDGAFHGTLAAFLTNVVLSLVAGAFPDDTVGAVAIMAAVLAGTIGGWLASRSYKEETSQ